MNERQPCEEDLVEVGHGKWVAIWSVKVNGHCIMADGSEEDVLQRYEWNSFAGDEGGWVPKPVQRHSPIDPACTDHHGYEERKKYGCTGPDPGQYVYSGDLMSKTKPVDHDCEWCDEDPEPVHEVPSEASSKELRDWLTSARVMARSYEDDIARLRSERQGKRQIITGQRDEIETLTAENARLRTELDRVRSLHVMRPGATVSAGSECGYCFEAWPCATIGEDDE